MLFESSFALLSEESSHSEGKVQVLCLSGRNNRVHERCIFVYCVFQAVRVLRVR